MVNSIFRNFIKEDVDNEYSVIAFELSNSIVDGYEGPYIISFCDGEIWCDKYFDEDEAKIFGNECVYVESNYYMSAKENNDYEEADYIVIITEDEDDLNESGFHFIYDTNGNISGFNFNNDGDGYCYNMRFCFCDKQDMCEITDMFNELIGVIAKYI